MLINSAYILILIITGVGVGFATGLLGVGGGFILAPVQFLLLLSLGIDPDTSIRIVFGTSLAVILPTAISGTYSHYCRKCVLIKPAVIMGIMGFLGGIIGGSIATHVPADILRIIFGLLLIVVSVDFLRFKAPERHQKRSINKYEFVFWGFMTGIASGLLGIGGGVVLVPIMVIILGFKMIDAVGTSSLIIIFTSVGGIISYILNGLYVPNLPPYSIGYINLLQFAILAVASIPMAQVGVLAAHKMPEKQLRYIFAVLLLYIVLKNLKGFLYPECFAFEGFKNDGSIRFVSSSILVK